MNDQYFASAEFRQKLDRYEAAISHGDSIYMDPDELTDIAEYYYQKGHTDRSLKTIEDAIDMFPGATIPLVFRSRFSLLKDNDIRQAEIYAEQIADKSDLDYFYIRAEIMIADNRTEEADRYLHDCYRHLDEDDAADFVLDVATLYADYNQMDKAQAWLQLSEESELADYKELQGRIAMSQGKYEESEHIFNQLLDEDPYSIPYWNQLASTQFMNNHIHESITSSEFSIAINPDDEEATLNKANGLYSLGNHEEALKYYRRYSELCPQDETGEILQGMALLNMNRLEEAATLFKKAEEKATPQSPNLLEIYQELAFTLSHLGKLNDALDYVSKAEFLPDSNVEELMVLRGHLLLEHGNIEDAHHYFQQAMQQSGSSPHIFLRIAISIYDCGFLKLSYKMFKTLLGAGLEGWNQGYAYLAACCKDLGKQDEYLLNLRKACTLNPMESQTILGDLFPPELPVSEYFQYAIDHQTSPPSPKK